MKANSNETINSFISLLKKTNGITLIALIITIVIILILAGISIKAFLNTNFFQKMQNVIIENQKGEEKEIIKLSWDSLYFDFLTKEIEITDQSLQKEISEGYNRNDVIVEYGDSSKEIFIITFRKTGNVYKIQNLIVTYLGKHNDDNDYKPLEEGIIKFTLNPNTWTNSNVEVEIDVNKDVSMVDRKLQWTRTPDNQDSWVDYNEQTKILSEENETIYARIYDIYTSKSVKATINITRIDKIQPVIESELEIIDVTTHNINATISVSDNASGISKIIWHCQEGTEHKVETVFFKDMNGENKGDTEAKTYTHLFNGLKQTSEYSIYTEVYDVSGNKVTSSTTNSGTLTVANLSIECTNAGYTNTGTKTIKITAGNSSYSTIRYTTDGTIPTATTTNTVTSGGTFTVSSNCTINAIAFDSANQVGTKATYTCSWFDTDVPTIDTAIGVTNSTTNSKTLSLKITDSGTGYAKTIWSYKKSTDSSWTTFATDTVSGVTMNGTQKGLTSQQTLSKIYTGLKQSTNYDFKAEVYDVSGNKATSSTTNSGTLTVANLSIECTNAGYTNTGTKTIKITAGNGNYSTIRYTTDGTIPTATTTNTVTSGGTFTVSSNCTINAIAFDSANQVGTKATYTCSWFDTDDPYILQAKYTYESAHICKVEIFAYDTGNSKLANAYLYHNSTASGNASETETFDNDGKASISINGKTSFGTLNYSIAITDKAGNRVTRALDINDIYISNETELIRFRDGTNNNKYTDWSVIQTADITLTTSWSNSIAKDENHAFTGTYNGNNKTITALTNNNTDASNQGFFGYNKGTIKDISIKNININGNSYVGGISGYNLGSISNCKIIYNGVGTIKGNYNIGGITGYNSGIINSCSVASGCGIITGSVSNTQNQSNVGGICGILASGGEIKNCSNGATIGIYNKGAEIGGIIGRTTVGNHTIENCSNTGSINATQSAHVGGIIGVIEAAVNNTNQTSLKYCKNTGTVNGAYSVGGILGRVGISGYTTIQECYNTGNITSSSVTASSDKNTYCGGIVGALNTYNYINYCYNTGSVTSTYNGETASVGGVVGWMASNTSVTQCYSKGTASATYGTYSYIGGVVGRKDGGTLSWNYCDKSKNEYAIGNSGKTGTNTYAQAYYSTNGSECKSYWNGSYWNFTSTWPTLKNN